MILSYGNRKKRVMKGLVMTFITVIRYCWWFDDKIGKVTLIELGYLQSFCALRKIALVLSRKSCAGAAQFCTYFELWRAVTILEDNVLFRADKRYSLNLSKIVNTHAQIDHPSSIHKINFLDQIFNFQTAKTHTKPQPISMKLPQ